MNHPRTYPPSGPRWTAGELVAARRRLNDAYRAAAMASDSEWVVAGWNDWWQDVDGLLGRLDYAAVCSLLNDGDHL